MHHISSCRYNLLPVCDIIVSDNISWSKMKITYFKLIVFRTFTHQQKNSFETLFKNTSGLYQKRVDISIQFPFNCIAEALPVDSAESNLCFALSICDCSAHSPILLTSITLLDTEQLALCWSPLNSLTHLN